MDKSHLSEDDADTMQHAANVVEQRLYMLSLRQELEGDGTITEALNCARQLKRRIAEIGNNTTR